MDQRLRNYYLEAQVNSGSPGQLLVMLYDRLIQHAESADTEIAAPENPNCLSQASHSVSRCIDILTELNRSLKHSVDPVLCRTLSALYLFFTREFSEAFDKRDPKKIRAILPLIRELRNAWSTAERGVNKFQVVAA